MGSSALLRDVLSPESTVTSLLSSSGHLRSSLRDPERTTTFTYRDKEYESASAALDAYISDFERSRLDGDLSVGRLVLPHCRSPLRNKDVLRERLTDVELDFLNLPVSSLCHRSNRDRLSMTTDELLSVPNDGSMPVTHSSAFIHSLRSHSGPFLRPEPGPRRGLGGSLNQRQTHLIQTLRTCRFRGSGLRPHVDLSSTVNRFDAGLRSEADLGRTSVPADVHALPHRAVDSEWAEPESSTLHLPHWLTSNKAHVDCSEISSVPELPYPAWIQQCEATETLSEPSRWDQQGVFPVAPQRTASWVEDLDDGPEQEDAHMTLRDIRLQFAQQISLLAAERQSCDTVDALFRENRIQSLIQKADQVLDSLSQSSTRSPDGLQDPGPDGLQDPGPDSLQDPGPDGLQDPGPDGLQDPGPDSLQDPDPDSLQDPGPDGLQDPGPDSLQDPGPDSLQDPGPDGLRDPVSPVDTVDLLIRNSSLFDPWQLSVDQRPLSFSSGLHGNQTEPGPVEALKQMLFRLQAVEAELQRRRRRRLPSETQESDLDGMTGGPSLQRYLILNAPETFIYSTRQQGGADLTPAPVCRALHHLRRLKLLVDQSIHKRTGEDPHPDLDRNLVRAHLGPDSFAPNRRQDEEEETGWTWKQVP